MVVVKDGIEAHGHLALPLPSKRIMFGEQIEDRFGGGSSRLRIEWSLIFLSLHFGSALLASLSNNLYDMDSGRRNADQSSRLVSRSGVKCLGPIELGK